MATGLARSAWVLLYCTLFAVIDVQAQEKTTAAPSESAKSEDVSKLRADLSAAQATIQRLEAEKQKSSADSKELSWARDELDKKTKEIADLQAHGTAKAEKAAKLSSQVASKDLEISTLEKDLKEAVDKHQKLEDEQKTALESLGTSKKEAAKLTEEMGRVSSDLSAVKAELAETKKSLEYLKAEAASKSQSLATLTSEKENAVQDLEEKVSVEKKAKDDLQSRLDAKAQLLGQQQKRFAELSREHTSLAIKHQTLRAQYADPSVQHFLTAKAVKVYRDPGISGAANKSFIYILPSLQDRYVKGQRLVNVSQAMVFSKLNAYVGSHQMEPWLPAVSGFLVYGAIIIPFGCTVCCLTRVVCKIRPLLMFCHLDFLITTVCAGVFALYTGKEPLAAFAHHDASVYLFTQAIFGVVYCLYFALLFCAYCVARGGTGEGLYRILQLCGAVPVGMIYYIHVWTPAMLDEIPRMDRVVALFVGPGSAVSNYAWLPYLPVSVVFAVLLRLERLSWFASLVGTHVDRKGDQMSFTMRGDLELATVIGEAAQAADAALAGTLGEVAKSD